MAKKNIGATLSLKDGNFFANLKKASSATDEFKKKLGLASNALKSHGKAADTIGTSLKSLAGKAAGVVAAFVSVQKAVSFGKDIVNTGIEFEQGMANVSAISGATGAELTALREKAKEMGATTKYSAIEASDAMSYMAMAGWSSSQMIDGIGGIMNLAAASGEELASVSDIVTDSLTAFGLKASDSADFADILAMACAKSNTNVAMLGEAFKNVAPTAGAMGYNVRDTTVALGLMASAGIKGGAAGTALNGVLTRLAKPTKEVSAAMSVLGLSAVNADGSMKPLSKFIPELQAKFSTLTAAQKGQYATMIAGKNAMSGFLALVNSSPSDFQSLTDAINNSTGAAQNMADTMNDTVSGKLTLLKSQVEGVKIAIFDALGSSQFKGVLQSMSDGLSAITPYVTTLTVAIGNGLFAAINKISGAASTVFTAVKTAVESSKPSFESIIDSCIRIKDSVAGMFSGDAGGSAEKFINGTIPTVVSAFASIMDKIADVTSFISAHKNIFEPLTVGILGAVAAVKLISGVSTVVSIISELGGIVGIVKGLGGMLLGVLGPTGWVIAGIAAAVTAIAVVVYKNWDTIKKTAQNLWNSIKNIFGGIGQWFAEKWAIVSNAVSSALRPVVSLFAPLGEQIAGVFTGAWDLVKMQWGAVAPFFASVWAGIKTPLIVFKDLAVMAFKIVFENLKHGFNQGLSAAVFVFNTIKTQAVFAGKVLWEAVKLVWVFFKNGITDAVKLLTAVVGTVSGVFKAVKAVMTGDFSGAAEALKGIWSRWKDFFVSVVDGVKENFSAAGTFFTNVWGAAVEAVKSQFNNLSTFISTFWTNVKTAAVNIGTTVVNSIGSILKTAFNGIMTQFENTINGGIRLINGAIGIINAIPGVSITTINDVKLPRLATGGIVTESTVANVGEAGPEAVLPLGQLWSQMDRFAEKVSERKTEEAKPSVIEKIIINVNGSGMSADEVVNDLMPKLKLAIANM